MNRTKIKTTKRTASKRNRKVAQTGNQNFTLVRSNVPAGQGEVSLHQNANGQPSQELMAQVNRQMIQQRQQDAACQLITQATERHLAGLQIQERGLALGIDNKIVQLIQHDESISFLRDSLTHAAFARVVTAALRCTAAGIEAAHYANERLRIAA